MRGGIQLKLVLRLTDIVAAGTLGLLILTHELLYLRTKALTVHTWSRVSSFRELLVFVGLLLTKQFVASSFPPQNSLPASRSSAWWPLVSGPLPDAPNFHPSLAPPAGRTRAGKAPEHTHSWPRS